MFATHTLPAAGATIESVILNAETLENLHDFVLSMDDETPSIIFNTIYKFLI